MPDQQLDSVFRISWFSHLIHEPILMKTELQLVGSKQGIWIIRFERNPFLKIEKKVPLYRFIAKATRGAWLKPDENEIVDVKLFVPDPPTLSLLKTKEADRKKLLEPSLTG